MPLEKIVLASASIDRRKILERSKVPFSVFATQVDEDAYKKEITNPIELIKTLARLKAITARETLKKRGEEAIIVAADTVIYHDGTIIGKASNEQEAFVILHQLMGTQHSLMTGIAITDTKTSKIVVDHDETLVTFSLISDNEIKEYLKLEEWKGRAGAYSLREAASLFVESIKGSPSNVLGLPMSKLRYILKKEFEINLFATSTNLI
ncbi:MAG: septum formation protein Maf [Candidatus Lokiarchaeota archaeon]|nr:septum formation protein Maf [Candidatus Lokiarchaeota archaeon]